MRAPLARISWKAAACAFLMMAASAPVHAQRGGDDVNYLDLAARLIADGYYDRADGALRNIDADDEGVDAARYHTLAGLVNLRSGRDGPAVDAFEAAIAAHEAEPKDKRDEESERARRLVYLYLGQAQFQRQRYAESLAALDAAGERAASIPGIHAMRAQAHWELGDRVAAIAALNHGQARFTEDLQFLRRKVFYLINMGFHQRAAELGQRYLRQAKATPDDYLAIGRALRRSGQHEEALKILERGRFEFPQASSVAVELAQVYAERDQTRTGADLMARVAMRDRGFRLEAAELQRKAGRLQRALMLNADVEDQAAKLRQRLSLLVEMGRWPEAAAMGDALRRNGLMQSDDIRYAWAYALFKDGDYAAADRALDGMAAGEGFRKATELRRVMEKCREAPWKCL